ncbi:MAG: DUF58 domain-containing protein [Vulcanisaeta sp.]
MIRVIISNKLMLIYLALSGITYIGLLSNNVFGVYFGLMLFIIITSYVLSWYLLVSLTLLYSQLVIDQDVVETVVGSQIPLSVKIVSKIPVKLAAQVVLMHPPHVQSTIYNTLINGNYSIMRIIGRWIGEARVIGGIVSIEEPMKLLTIQRVLIRNVKIVIRPGQAYGWTSRPGIVGYQEYGVSTEGRLGDLRSLINYDYEKPASTIHWITSARVGELVMINWNEYGSCPVIIMNASSRMLIPKDGERPIDKALHIISNAAQQCNGVKVVLVSKEYIEQRIVSRESIPYLEYDVRMRIVKNNISNAIIDIPNYFRKYIHDNQLIEIAYILNAVDDEPTSTDINKAIAIVSGRNIMVLIGISTNHIMNNIRAIGVVI